MIGGVRPLVSAQCLGTVRGWRRDVSSDMTLPIMMMITMVRLVNNDEVAAVVAVAVVAVAVAVAVALQALSPKPETLSPKSQTLNPKP